ncbi:hypothetical protein [Streptomyces sp. NPDC048111]|uniref:hypothetical protein n=1 Tax=Streptomyces sp. NPDC048111 TaxID=3365500 RepID=UPI00371B1A34
MRGERERGEVMRRGGVWVVGVAVTGLLVAGCGASHARPGSSSSSTPSVGQMEKKVSDAESAAAAADQDTQSNQ